MKQKYLKFFYDLARKQAKRLVSLTVISSYLVNSVAPGLAMEQPESIDKRTVRILAIDGGEIPGVIPATILEAMEEILQSSSIQGAKEARLADCFDLMVGSSTGALSVLFLNARDAENNLYGADKLYEFYQQLHDSPAGCLSILERYFGNRWLNEATTSLLIPAYNVGQKSPWFFDSEHAKFPSKNFKMRNIAYVSLLAPSSGGIAIKSQKEEGEGKEETDYKFHNLETTHSDVTLEALTRALNSYPGCDFFVASLGTGEVPRAFGVGEGYSFDTILERATQDRHLSQLNELRKQAERRIDYIRIQLTLGACSTSDKNTLRQAGLYASNPSGREYAAFQRITQELFKAYQEEHLSNKVLEDIDSKEVNPNFRPWKKVDGEVLDNLYEATSVDGLIESYPEGSSKSYLTLLWEQLHKDQSVTISSSSKAALSGMGGIGKTSLAAQYAHEALAHQAYRLIYWIASETEDKLKKSYESLLDEFLDVRVEKDSNFKKLLNLVNRHIAKQEPYLLI